MSEMKTFGDLRRFVDGVLEQTALRLEGLSDVEREDFKKGTTYESGYNPGRSDVIDRDACPVKAEPAPFWVRIWTPYLIRYGCDGSVNQSGKTEEDCVQRAQKRFVQAYLIVAKGEEETARMLANRATAMRAGVEACI